MDNRATWETRFTHPMVEALSVEEMISLQGGKVVWASGDATLDRIGAVDWSSNVAFAVSAAPLKLVLQKFMREAVEAGDAEDDESESFIISILELLTVVVLVSVRAREWAGKLVAYAGDNTNVIRWLEKRGAKHPVASYLLQVLAAIEASHAIRVHGAYIRTYHNETADDLTRLDAKKVMEEKGLEDLHGRPYSGLPSVSGQRMGQKGSTLVGPIRRRSRSSTPSVRPKEGNERSPDGRAQEPARLECARFGARRVSLHPRVSAERSRLP